MDAAYWSDVDELHSAVYAGDSARVAQLLAEAPRLAYTLLQSDDGTPTTSLHVAAKAGCVEIGQLLISAGAARALASAPGPSPAVVASFYGHFRIAALLEEAAKAERRRAATTPLVLLLKRRLRAASLYVWLANAVFCGCVYVLLLARSATPALNVVFITLYVSTWTSWLFVFNAKPDAPSAAAKRAYTQAVCVLFAGEGGAPNLEEWVSHRTRTALRPRDRVCRSGGIWPRYDHFCGFAGNAIFLRNQVAFFLYLWLLAFACIVFFALCVTKLQTETTRWEKTVQFAALNCALCACAVGALSIRHTWLILRNVTSAELAYDIGGQLYHANRKIQRNPFDRGWRTNVVEFLSGELQSAADFSDSVVR